MNNGHLLVTGASGFVGNVLCRELLARDYFVSAVLRSSADSNLHGVNIVFMPEISADSDWKNHFCGISTIIHLAARVHVMRDDAKYPLEEFRKVNVAGTERLARAAAASGVKRLVYVSSIKVNGEATYADQKFTETDVPSPQDPYGISKWEAEQSLHRIAQETGMEVVIVRTPLVYGARVRGNFVQMLDTLVKGIPLPLACVNNRRSLMYVGNLVDALIACATHSAAVGKTYLVSDGEDVSTPDLLRNLGASMEYHARLFPCPIALLKLSGRLLGKSNQIERLLESLRVDSGKIRRELNWTPPYTLQQGLKETAEWYRNTYL